MYMKKLILLFALLPVLTWAFPVATNRLDFDPAQSTGAFDDFLWRWSGFDDQRVELIFRNTVAPSNVGFRLAYPQRGKTFLDVLPPAVPAMTNIVETNITPWRITYQYAPLYPTITTPAFSNVFVTNFVLLTRDGAVSLSNTVTRVVTPASVTNIFGTNIVVGTNGRTTSNLFLNATSLVSVISDPVVTVPQERQHVNYTLGTTSTVTTVQSLEYLPVVDGNTNFYSIGPSVVANGTFTSNLDGWDGFTTTGGSTTNVFWSGGRANIRGSNVLQQVVSGLTLGQRYYFSADVGGLGSSITMDLTLGDNTVNRPINTTIVSNNIVASSTSLLILFTPKNIPATSVVTIDNVLLRPVSTTRFVDTTNVVTTATEGSAVTNFQTAFSVITNQTFKTETRNYYRTEFAIDRTNIPPDGPYFAEVLTYSGASTTNPTQSRTLAKGQVTIENSIWGITNYAGYTNYPGPWNYLLQDGSRPMAGDLNMGGNAVTNASRFAFSDGSSIASSNVALWNSFIQGTNVGLTANTVFDGQVTGLWNNLTLKSGVGADGWSKYAATQTVDFAGNIIDDPTLIQMRANGTTSTNPGALYWNSAFGTLNLVMDKINPDGTPVINEIGYNSLVRVKNSGSTTISNTWAVSIVPGAGGILTVERARQPDKTRVIGIASHHIPAGEEGIVNYFGEISQAATFGLTEGTPIYLSTATNGLNWTTNDSPATAGASPMRLGYVDTTASSAGAGNGKIIVDIFDIEADPIAMAALTNYLPLTGGTMNSNLLFAEGYGIENISEIVARSGQSIDLNSEPALFGGNWGFLSQPDIPGYLTTTGAAATYVELNNLPAGIVTTNNLSTIAGSGLGVVSNRLAVTNITSYQSSLTGIVQVSGIDVGTGSNLIIRAGNRSPFGGAGGSVFINPGTDGANNWGSVFITNNLIATRINGVFGGSVGGDLTIKGGDANPSQAGGNLLIGGGTPSGLATNGQVILLTTFNAGGNSITNIGLLQGNAANLTNFPSSILTVSAGNANYWRVTTAPTGATASGSSGQMAVDGTNLFIYSPNALGVGTARWLRVSGNASW